MRNLMIELGTIGVRPGCPIVSIGAVPFDLNTGETGNPFFITINEHSNLLYGLLPEAETEAWWKGQSEEARRLNFSGAENLPVALRKFRSYVSETFPDGVVCAWGNSVRFHLGILQYAYDSCKQEYPFDPFSERDFRTVMSFLPHVRYSIKFEGDHHHPVHSAYHKVRCVNRVYTTINQALDKALM